MADRETLDVSRRGDARANNVHVHDRAARKHELYTAPALPLAAEGRFHDIGYTTTSRVKKQ